MAPEVTAVLLAAGSSRRMRKPKQLLPVGNKSALQRCLDSILASGAGDVVVVINGKGEEIAGTLAHYPVSITVNEKSESEMSDSVQTGLPLVGPSSTGVMICLADHPLTSKETMQALVRLHAEDPSKIIIPSFNSRRGHPTLFPVELLRDLPPETTLRSIIGDHEDRIRYLETDDEGVVLDMDTPEDYAEIVSKAKERE